MTTTTKLTELQTLILTNAAGREDLSVFPLSDAAETKRQTRSLQSLLTRDLIERMTVTDDTRTWKRDGDTAIGLVLTHAGRAAVDTGSGCALAEPLQEACTADAAASQDPDTSPPPATRSGTKQALVLELLGRAEGATLEQLASATGWLPHTVRASLTGLRKKQHAIDSTKSDDVRTYRLSGAAS